MLKGLLSFVKKGVTIIGILILVILGIMICIATGWLIRWMIWLACFFIDFWYDWAIIDWIVEHDTIMLIICSCIAPFLLLAEFIKTDSSDDASNQKKSHSMNTNHTSGNLSDSKSAEFFVDASGAYRNFGDDFIDCRGNWCKWGTGFYDYDGNYIKWGDIYKDCSGAYRRWGEDFIDGSGNWVHL